MNGIQLYEHQDEFVQGIRNVWKDNKRIMAMAVTGFGKTRCAAKIIEGVVSRGMRVAFLVPRISLIEQTAHAFSDLGLQDITYLWGAFDTDYSAKITIASIDTYIRREKGEYDLVIVDEAHHIRKQLVNWMEQHPEERYIGLSATPFNDCLGRYYTALVKSKSMRWMIDNGYLAPYDIYAPDVPNLSGVKQVNTPDGRDYKESSLSDIMGDAKVVGNVVKNWLQHGENRRTMALCVNVAHANHLLIEFSKAGVPCDVITANTPIEERSQIFKRTKEGINKIIMSVNCLTEGFDMPEIDCLINARPTKSRARWSQGCGRVLRYMPDKRAIIFDHSGTSLDLGYPEDMTIDELNDGSEAAEARQNKKESEQKEKVPKLCTKCNYLKPAGVYVCPKCGFKPVVGVDVDVDESRGLVLLKGEKKKEYTTKDKQAYFSELHGYNKERFINTGKKFSDGWIAHKYKEKFGVWPRSLHSTPIAPTPETRNMITAGFIRFNKGQGK